MRKQGCEWKPGYQQGGADWADSTHRLLIVVRYATGAIPISTKPAKPAPRAKKAASPKAATKKTAVKRVRKPAGASEADTTPTWRLCVNAIEEKKGTEVRVLDLRPVTSFADYFVLASASNTRQVQAIADEVVRVMKAAGDPPNSAEGYANAEWVLLDFGDLVVHVFSDKARQYYELDRLWRDAPQIPTGRKR
ncbi:MAG: ribosome silencing factor [Bryobacteraceae bacterium]